MLQKTYLALKKYASKYVEPWDELLVDRAFELASAGHRGQLRESGESYIFHPIEVARIVADLRCDLNTFLAAILHDVIEDSDVRREQLTDEFGKKVSSIVEAVTKISQDEHSHVLPYEQKSEESLRKVIVGSAKNLRVAYVKLSDRLHNLATLEAKSAHGRERTIDETRKYLAPLARELGIGRLYHELLYWSFKLANPDAQERNLQLISKYQDDYKQQVGVVWHRLAGELQKLGIIGTGIEVDLRYSLVRDESPDTVGEWLLPYDLILVFESVNECYVALGILHSLWPAVFSRYGDWIAQPLPNGYRAIHTVIQTSTGKLVKIRLQTQEMHRLSEWGLLSHLRGVADYDEAYRSSPQARTLEQIIDLDNAVESTERFLEYLRLDILRPKMRVFMEDGFIHLPVGATVLDLAYYRGDMVGHRCRGALVNGKASKVDAVLRHGDVVKLRTEKIAKPDSRWEFQKTYMTAKAKLAILQAC